jgi:hypothetical protein
VATGSMRNRLRAQGISSSLGFARDKSDSLQDDMQQSTGPAPQTQKRRFRPEARGAIYCAPTKAVVGLESGCALMVQETRLAVQNLAEEAKMQTRLRK